MVSFVVFISLLKFPYLCIPSFLEVSIDQRFFFLFSDCCVLIPVCLSMDLFMMTFCRLTRVIFLISLIICRTLHWWDLGSVISQNTFIFWRLDFKFLFLEWFYISFTSLRSTSVMNLIFTPQVNWQLQWNGWGIYQALWLCAAGTLLKSWPS